MNRFTAARLAVSFAAAAAALQSAHASENEPKTRTFHFEYNATVNNIPTKARQLSFWMPIPHNDDYQTIENLRIDSPYPYQLAASPDGNQILHLSVAPPAGSAFSIRLSFDAARKEHIQESLYGGPPPPAEDPNVLRNALKPSRLVPLDDRIRGWAREVVQEAGAQTQLEMARAIYNHVVATVKYDKSGKGWGRGDIYYACEERRGNCTDFHAIVIGYARALGIPARFAIGFPLPADRGAGKIAGYHCWAEVYVKGTGWIPIDASEAAKNPAKRTYFFGAHDENRIEFSKGRDIELSPPQNGEPLNYFVYPYVEVDGRPFAGVTTDVSYRDIAPRAEALRGEGWWGRNMSDVGCGAPQGVNIGHGRDIRGRGGWTELSVKASRFRSLYPGFTIDAPVDIYLANGPGSPGQPILPVCVPEEAA